MTYRLYKMPEAGLKDKEIEVYGRRTLMSSRVP